MNLIELVKTTVAVMIIAALIKALLARIPGGGQIVGYL